MPNLIYSEKYKKKKKKSECHLVFLGLMVQVNWTIHMIYQALFSGENASNYSLLIFKVSVLNILLLANSDDDKSVFFIFPK